MVGADLGAVEEKRGDLMAARRGGSAWKPARAPADGATAEEGRGGGRISAGRHSAPIKTYRARVSGGETRARFVPARVCVLPIQ